MPEFITRKRNLEFAILDISAQPHPQDVYRDLFESAIRLRRPLKILGNDYAEIAQVKFWPSELACESIEGSLYRFTKIDPDADWFDREKGEVATDTAKNEISIPPNLLPNSRTIHWYFDIKSHLLVIVTKNAEAKISAAQAETYFQELLDLAMAKTEGVDYVDVNTVKDSDVIDRIFKKARVTSLLLSLKRPNLDDPAEAMKRVEKIMEEERVKRWDEILKSEDNKSIVKSERIETLLHASERLGRAEAVTYDEEENREKIDTQKHPKIHTEQYDPELNVPLKNFVEKVAKKAVKEATQSIKKKEKKRKLKRKKNGKKRREK